VSEDNFLLGKLFGIGCRQIRTHFIQVGFCLLASYSGLEMTDYLEHRMSRASLGQNIFTAHLSFVDDGHEEI
jgi:hypothetical protein